MFVLQLSLFFLFVLLLAINLPLVQSFTGAECSSWQNDAASLIGAENGRQVAILSRDGNWEFGWGRSFRLILLDRNNPQWSISGCDITVNMEVAVGDNNWVMSATQTTSGTARIRFRMVEINSATNYFCFHLDVSNLNLDGVRNGRERRWTRRIDRMFDEEQNELCFAK